MKKNILSKIVLGFIGLSILAFSLPNAFANVVELSKSLDDVIGSQCVNLTDAQKHTLDGSASVTNDEGFLITIMEEPFGENVEKVNDKGEKIFYTKRCYRNSVRLVDKENHNAKSLTELSTKCSDTAEEYVKTLNNENYSYSYSCQEVTVIFSKGGTVMIEGYITMIYRWGANIVGIIAVLIIVVSGIQMAAAGGNQEAVTSARGRIVKSLVALALLFLSGLFLYTINPNFFVR